MEVMVYSLRTYSAEHGFLHSVASGLDFVVAEVPIRDLPRVFLTTLTNTRTLSPELGVDHHSLTGPFDTTGLVIRAAPRFNTSAG